MEHIQIANLFYLYFQKPDVLFDTKMSLYESFLKEAVETLQIVKDELKNYPVSSFKNYSEFQILFLNRHLNQFQSHLQLHHVIIMKNYPMVFGFIVTLLGFVYQK
jgi:hypothetical protein